MTTTAATLLQAWEAGAAAPALDRATSLLESLGALPDDASVDELTVGQCDARLFALRRAMFGETLDVVATCPECDTEVELELTLSELQPPVLAGPAGPIAVEANGYTVLCRIPSNHDLRELSASGEVGIRELVDRCALEAHAADGPPVLPGDLPDATLDTIAAELANSDPGAFTALRVRCPCGSEFVDELEIRSVVWNDLTDWVARTLTEVHQLAHAYGWSEAEILSLGGWRRRWYLEACGW